MIACVAAATMFTACNSGSKETKTEEAPATEAAAPAAETKTTSEGNVIDEYAVLVDEMIDLTAKVKAGDAAAAQKIMDLSQKAQGMATKLAEELPNMTAEQKAKFEEIQKKAMDMAKQ